MSRFRFKRRRNRHGRLCRIIVCVFLFLVLSLFYLELQVRPKITDLAKIKAQAMATESINTAVMEQLDSLNITYDDLMSVNYKDDKTIGGISTNMIEMNKLKSAISIASQDKIGKMNQREIHFKSGDLSGIDLLSGRGPEIVVKLNFSGSITTQINSKFLSAGVNQTQHIIEVEITANIHITSESMLESTLVVTTNVPIAETVIVGQVPSLYGSKYTGLAY
ncbi:MAG TPA: sporulation protein YunB [Clostridiales bacterium]|nr:sporulation protein YunB [Clostridiales bacterium]